MDKPKVLFVCEHNTARSQMAEAFLRALAGDRFEAYTAGLEPGELNPLAVEVMKEVGINISDNETKSVFDFYKRGEFFSYVITVCDEAAAERCPIFPGVTQRINWSLEDPADLAGSVEEKLKKTRQIQDEIRAKVEEFIRSTS